MKFIINKALLFIVCELLNLNSSIFTIKFYNYTKLFNKGEKMALDKELVNFSEEHELNAILSKFSKSQSQKNRATLGELGKKCKEKLAKRVLTQDEFGEFVKAHLKELEDKKA